MTSLVSSMGDAIKLCRNRRRLNQSELADKAGISVSYLSLIEQGKRAPNIDVLNEIAEALQIPLNLLVFLASDKSELASIDKSIAERLSLIVLELIDNDDHKSPVPN